MPGSSADVAVVVGYKRIMNSKSADDKDNGDTGKRWEIAEIEKK